MRFNGRVNGGSASLNYFAFWIFFKWLRTDVRMHTHGQLSFCKWMPNWCDAMMGTPNNRRKAKHWRMLLLYVPGTIYFYLIRMAYDMTSGFQINIFIFSFEIPAKTDRPTDGWFCCCCFLLNFRFKSRLCLFDSFRFLLLQNAAFKIKLKLHCD